MSGGFLFGSGSRSRGGDARKNIRYGQSATSSTAKGAAPASGRYGVSSRSGAAATRVDSGGSSSGVAGRSSAAPGSSRLGLPSHGPGSSKPLRAAASFRVDTRSPTSVGSGSPAMGSLSGSMRRAASFRDRDDRTDSGAAASKPGLFRSGTSRTRTLGGINSGSRAVKGTGQRSGASAKSSSGSRSGIGTGGSSRADPGSAGGSPGVRTGAAKVSGGGGSSRGMGAGAGAAAGGGGRAGESLRAGTHATAGKTTASVGAGAGAGAGTSAGSGSGSGSGASTPKGGLVRRSQLEFSLRDLRLEKTVGTGTFGRVRVVFHRRKKKYFALKILKKSEIIRLKQVDHIRNEIRIMSCVDHPFIVNLVGFIQDRKRIYMLLEYVPGGELFTHLRAVEKFSSDAAKFYSAEIALAFDYLHTFDVIYRDLKPENLLISKRGHIKITDFGFAKVVRAGESTYTLCGTPEYLAPEIIQSKGHGRAVDWWALGVLIYEMLAGYPPYFDESPFGIYQKILAGRLSFTRDFSDNARDLVRKLLNPDRTRRLGCLRDGAKDIKSHRWFSRVSWDGVQSRSIPPPFIPKVSTENDTTNFEEYSDSDDDTARELSSKEARLFVDMDDF